MAVISGLTKARMETIEAASVVAGHINEEGQLILVRHDTSEFVAGELVGVLPEASDTVPGIIELATEDEVIAGTDDERAVTPAGLHSALDELIPSASTTDEGTVELATDVETIAGTDTTRAVTPASLATASMTLVPAATLTVAGRVELATDAETLTGTDATRAVTPDGLDTVIQALVTPKAMGRLTGRMRTSNSSNSTSSTGVGVIKLSASVISGRKIRVWTNRIKLTSGLGDEVALVLRYTTNGVDPTTSDTILASAACTIENASRYNIVSIDQPYFPGSSHTFKVSMFVARLSGSGNAAAHAVEGGIYLEIEDCGVPIGADAGSGADL